MSAMKQFAEDVSEDMGLDGEITDAVLNEAQRRLEKGNMNYFVSVTMYQGRACVKVDGRADGIMYFPLTAKGCRAAGAWIAEKKQESWMNSSSVDFPKEIKPSFRHDVRELMNEGFAACIPDEVVKHDRVGDYEIYGNQFVAIAVNVNNPKDSHYFNIDPDVNNNAFIRACGWAYEPED